MSSVAKMPRRGLSDLSELTTRSATQLRDMMRTGALSAHELVTEHLHEIGRLNASLHAFVDVDHASSLTAARRADEARSRGSDLPLLGLPISIKSSIEVAGLRCETGTRLHQGFIPNEDAEAVRTLKAAGAIVLGTTNCPELLMAYETDNLLYGRTANPWDLDYSAGGSSGGEAAAIAAGLSTGGLGSDSGGSVRQPAHCTGICAFKPTSSRISSRGHTLPCVGPFSLLGSLGPMARSMADVTRLFDVLDRKPRGSAARNPMSTEELRSRAVGILYDDGLVPVCAQARHAVEQAAAALAREGFTIKPFRSALLEPARKLWWTFFMRCGRLLLEPAVVGREHDLSPTFRYYLETVRAEPLLSADELLAAWSESDALRDELERELAAYTAVVTPVSSVPAFRFGERSWTINGQPIEYFSAMRFTQWFNLLGAPAAVIPIHLNAEPMPVGVQIAGCPRQDEYVLAVAGLLDQHFAYRVPPMPWAGGAGA